MVNLFGVHPLVDIRDLVHPALPLAMFEIENGLRRPVEVVGDKGYLLVKFLEGVAYDSPKLLRGTSN